MSETTSLARQSANRSAKIIDTSTEILSAEPRDDEKAFGAKCLVSASLPYRNPKPEQLTNGAWVRKNGDYTLWIQGGPQGIPFGTYPRLFVIWLTSEAVRTGSRRISTGGNFAEFCRKLNIDRSRGKNGAGRRLIDQADRLLNSRAAFITGNIDTTAISTQIKKTELLQFAEDFTLFFDQSENERQDTLFQSEIILTEKFFNEITAHCIPLDLRAVLALQQSPLELDIYQWLAYRMFSLKSASRPTWLQLYNQFGSSYGRLRDFRADFLKALNSVKSVYPRLNVDYSESGLILLPSPTPVPPRLEVVNGG
ncbi:replication protein RepA [Paraburkholderia hospita]|uniref:replication protein RepA n=1 Tax=Paraburkholderia hospita TaxID=169430 RepID=UPI0008A726A2|nr:replication protein RepA [Paraburkholderia hospita]SEI14409.1 RepA protein [Paraburkholderia hospita]